ncbi:MBL fold metallo-hydrolase [Natrarchaeobaculum aegyptiacum]|uniref:MBL fold metallo-hydrolase n=1 Tax=Natrarchaeobaculum aegyptiacum TaxID=745377 RepID=A0A2Z2HST4_9EURY|nr:MBL fold metallo-hydrolase [Natrarchaeobaculum aegyptiacum]ARS90276.1 MBL fold metallo-hydrolase [Natrarchaeobaculum aegyptiacum]
MSDSRSDANVSPEDPPTSDGVSRLHFEVDWPPKHAAAYLIESPDRAPILIDAGDPTDRGTETMIDELAARGYEPADVGAVIVTHPHTDHTGQVPLFVAAGVPVYAPDPVLEQLERDEADLVAGVREVARSAGLRGEAIEKQVDRARDSLQRNRDLLDPDEARPYSFDGVFSIDGRTFEPIHTPGHQIHHASLGTVIDGDRVLFSGDALIEPFRAAALHVGLDHGAYESIDAFYVAMDRLESVAPAAERAYPGHGPVFEDVEGVVHDTRYELDTLVADTLEAVRAAGPATPVELTRHRVGESRHPAQLLDTIGALGRLQSGGAIVRERDDGMRYYRSA